MSNYYEESTNFTSNPFTHQTALLKQKLIQQLPSQPYDQEYSQTIAHPNILIAAEEETIKPGKLPKKIKTQNISSIFQDSQQAPSKINQTANYFDDEVTKTRKLKGKVNKKNTSQGPQQSVLFLNDLTSNKNQCVNQKNIPAKIIPEPSPQVESILSGPKLREKYGHLLPKSHQKSLSFQQQHLLKILSMMDETIEFSNQNRATKFIFFQELRKIMRDSLKVFIEIKQLQQLLYLDETLFEVKWEWSFGKRGYDIMITQPKIKSKDQRNAKVRQIILEFLNQKHHQFLIEKTLKVDQKYSQWHSDFEPARYEIPRKPIPAHPETRDAELRCFDKKKIEEIKNPKLKELVQSKKQQSEVQSFKSKSVMDMIFAGVKTKNIEMQILAAVKQRQENVKRNKEQDEKRIQKQKSEIDPEILKELSQTILLIYMSNSVSNMHKVKLLEVAKSRTNHKFGNYIVERHLQHLIELKQIGYLKEIVTSANKPVIVTINKGKAKEIAAYAESLKQKEKQNREKLNDQTSAQIII